MNRAHSQAPDCARAAARRVLLLSLALTALACAAAPPAALAQTAQAATANDATAKDPAKDPAKDATARGVTAKDAAANGAAKVAAAVVAVPLPAPGVAAERTLGGGDTHAYEVALRAGEFVAVAAEQREVNVRLTFYAPGGAKLLSANWETGLLGAERVCVAAEADGVYRLEVAAELAGARPGAYRLTAGAPRPATEDDRRRFAADRLMWEADGLQAKRAAATMPEAVRKHQEAARLLAELGDAAREATALQEAGLLQGMLGERRAALASLERAVELTRDPDNRLRHAQALGSVAVIHYKNGDLPRALELTRRSLELFREVGDRRWVALALGNYAVVVQATGDTPAAVEQQLEALRARSELGDRSEEAVTLNNIGRNYSELGEKQKALDYLHRSLALFRSLGRERQANARTMSVLSNLGLVYGDLGEHAKSLAYHEEGLAVARAAGDRNSEAILLDGVGRAHAQLGDAARAREYGLKALALARETGNRKAEALALQGLGQGALEAGDYARAVEHLSGALALDRAGGSRKREAATLASVGTAYRLAGDRARSLEHFRQALAIARDLGDPTFEAQTLGEEARLELDAGNLAEARAAVESALGRVEAVRGKLAGQRLRTAYFASVQSYYRLHVEILMALHRARPAEGFDALALHAVERARARGLLDLLAESGADVRRGGDPLLLERERALRHALSAKAEQHLRVLTGSAPSGEHVRALTREIAALAEEYEQLQARIRQSSPRYAALTQPEPAGLREIQGLLDADTLLLEYALGERRSYLWVVGHDSLASYELPGRAEVERAARRFYDLLTAAQAEGAGELGAAGDALARMVLAPAAARLGSKRLLVVADGALHYVPFSALPEPKGQTTRTGEAAPLVAGHEVVSLPSATTLGVLRRELSGRAPAPKALAVIADPVFSPHDPRVKTARGASVVPAAHEAAEAVEAVTRAFARTGAGDAAADKSGDKSGASGIPRLPFSRREAETIYGLAPAGQALKALDFSASRATATGGALSQYRVVHFATHGLLNAEHPELSGVVLSLFDRRGQPADGFLRLGDVYNLNLPAELVVLSACQTGLGKEVQGEGLVGLTRGFFYAGAARVAASLWKVDDAGTAELMRRFYTGMLRDGLRPAAALRAAKVEMMRQPRWRSPYFWAAFELQGEWK